MLYQERPKKNKNSWAVTVRFFKKKRNPSRKSVTLSHKTRTGAQSRASEVIRLYINGEYDPWMDEVGANGDSREHPGEINWMARTLGRLLKRYVEYKKAMDWSPGTAEINEKVLALFIADTGPNARPDILSTTMIHEWVTKRYTSAGSRSSITTRIITFCNWLHEEGYIEKKIKRPRFPVDVNPMPVYCTPSELTLIKATIARETRRHARAGRLNHGNSALWLIPFIDTAVYTGIRLSMLLQLRVEDINLETGEIIVGRRQPTKNRIIRVLPAGEIKPLMHVLRAQARRLERQGKYTADTRFFGHTDPRRTSRTFRKYARIAVPGKNIKFHALRHTCGTMLASAGLPLNFIAEWLGHKDLRSTLIYAKIKPYHLKKEVGRAFRD